jgi:hypothetical protein
MLSKRVVLTIVLLFITGGLAIYFFPINNTASEKKSQVVPTTPTPTPVTLLTWIDEAGFSFQYPDGTIVDKHPEDTKNYANLSLTLPSGEVVSIIIATAKPNVRFCNQKLC